MPYTEKVGGIPAITSNKGVLMSATVLVGTQWGDEGKGKVTDLISGDFDVVCRYAGGANAGHTVIVGNTKLALHQVPSGVMYDGVVPIIGNGCIVDPEILLGEEIGRAHV